MNYLISFVFLLFLVDVHAQAELQIKTVENEPIPGARFEAMSLVDTVIIRQIADSDGIIHLVNSKGLYLVKVSSYGYAQFEDSLILEGNVIIRLDELQIVEEVVVTAQAKATSVENAVQKITIISEDQIRSAGANNLADILTYQTGVRINQDNVLGSSMDLSGISGQNVKILIDGVPVVGRLNGNIDLSQINLNNVERIEVVEGPLSVNFGTNALAGTVNIITKKKSKPGFTLEVSPYYETVGNYNFTGNLTWSTKAQHLVLDGGRNFFDGWTDNDPFIQFPRETLADTNRIKTWKPKEQYFAGLRYSVSQSKWQMSAYGKYFDELIVNRGMPTAPYYESAFDDYYSTQRADAGMTNQFHTKKGSLNLLFAYNDYIRKKNTYLKDLTTLNEVQSQSTGAQDTTRFNQYTGRFIYSGSLKLRLNYQIGLDLNHSTGWGQRIAEGEQSIGDYAGFATVDWKIIDSLTIKPGIRYEYNTSYNAPLVPSLNLLYRIRNLSFRASLARGFRAPDLKELYLDFVDVNHNITGNPDLKAEDSWNYALYVNWMKQLKRNTLIKVEYGAYYNDINNLITLGTIENMAYTYINIGNYSTIGQQISLNYRNKRLNLNLNATYIGRYNMNAGVQDIVSYSFSPEVGARMQYEIIKEKFKLNVFYKFNGSLLSYNVDSEDKVSMARQSSYNILDASVTLLMLKDKHLSMTLGAKNLLNVKQVNVTGQTQTGAHSDNSDFYAGRGTSVFLSLRYSLNLIKTNK